MKMKMNSYKIKVALVLILAMCGIVWFAMALEHRHFTKPVLPKKQMPRKEAAPITYDSVLLMKFAKTIHSLDFNNKS
jgi:hypothetical protein